MSSINIRLTIENLNLGAIEKVASNAGLQDAFCSVKNRSVREIFCFLDKHRLGFIDDLTHQYLSHDKAEVFCLVYRNAY